MKKELNWFGLILVLLVMIIFLFIVVLMINRQVNNVQLSNSVNSTAEVTGVIDGDTFFISEGMKVRLICVDSPEFGERGYWEARRYLESKIKGKNVTLVKDISERDSYGRLLRYLYFEGNLINEMLVKDGFARAYPYGQDVSLCNRIQDAEKYAKERKLGIWNFSEL